MIHIRIVSILILILMLASIIGAYHLLFGFNPLDIEWWHWLRQVIFSTSEKPSYIVYPAIIAGGVGLFLIILSFVLLSRASATTISGQQKANTLHGSARWAKWKDVKKNEFHKHKGVVIGGFKKSYFSRLKCLQFDGPEHVLAFAPTRTGKGVSLIIPTLLKWQESAFVLDIKGENHALTAGYRQSQGQRIIRFEPSAEHGSLRYNPLEEVAYGKNEEIGDVQNIAANIVNVDAAAATAKDPMWIQSGAEFLTAGILHVLSRVDREDGRRANITDVRRYLSGVEDLDLDEEDAAKQAMNEMFREWIEFDHENDYVDREVKSVATRYFSMAHQTRTGIIQNAMFSMAIFADPNIQNNLSQSDFQITDLMREEQPMSLYLVIPPKNIDRLKPIVRIFITQMLRRLMDKMEFVNGQIAPNYKHRLLLMMDEFPAFGKMPMYQNMLAYMAGYGIKSYVIVQGIPQLEEEYGENQSFFTNSKIRIAFTPNEDKTARLLSNMLGDQTILQRKRQRSSEQGKLTGNFSDNISETKRALLTPDEVQRIKLMEKGWFGKIHPGDMLIFVAASPPIFGKQYLFFNNKKMVQQTRIPAPIHEAKADETANKESGADDIISFQPQNSMKGTTA